jgi:hypothetical protein
MLITDRCRKFLTEYGSVPSVFRTLLLSDVTLLRTAVSGAETRLTRHPALFIVQPLSVRGLEHVPRLPPSERPCCHHGIGQHVH